jgi:hypothetical protein
MSDKFNSKCFLWSLVVILSLLLIAVSVYIAKSEASKYMTRVHGWCDVANVIGPITLNASTSVKIADANHRRIYFYVTNGDGEPVWIKPQPANTDNEKKGIYLGQSGETPNFWEMQVTNIYAGEISAIAVSGNPEVYVTEY